MVQAPWAVHEVRAPRSAHSGRPNPQVSHKGDTVLGFRVHRMLQAEFLQAALVTIYDYYEPCEWGRDLQRPSRGLGPREPGSSGGAWPSCD